MISENSFVNRVVQDFLNLVEAGNIKLEFTTFHDKKTEKNCKKFQERWLNDRHENGKIVERVVYPYREYEWRDTCNSYDDSHGSKSDPVTITMGF